VSIYEDEEKTQLEGTYTLDSDGYCDVTLRYGYHAFYENYKQITKWISVLPDTDIVVCGVWIGSLQGNGTNLKTVTLPKGQYTKVTGTLGAGLTQTNSGGLATNMFPGGSCTAYFYYNGNTAATKTVSMSYRGGNAYDVSRSTSDSSTFNYTMSNTGGNITVGKNYSTSQEGFSNIKSSGSASVSNLYIY